MISNQYNFMLRMQTYSLSHNYCEHHFFGIFQILL